MEYIRLVTDAVPRRNRRACAFLVSLFTHVVVLTILLASQQFSPTLALGAASPPLSIAVNVAKPTAPAKPLASKPVLTQAQAPIDAPLPVDAKSVQPHFAELPRVEPPTEQAEQTVESEQTEVIAVSGQSAETMVDEERHHGPPLIDDPVFYSQQAPRYPRRAKIKGQQGTVLLALDVDELGLVMNVSIEQSSGYQSLDNAAVKAVKRWRLEPAKRAGVAVASRVKVPIRFDLQSS